MGILTDNPVLQRETRGRLRLRRVRGSRGALWVAGAVGLVVAYFYLRGLAAVWRNPPQDAKDFWSVIVYGLLVLIVLLGPAISSTAITQEREQQTWETLGTTQLTAGEVLLGKWLARQTPMGVLLIVLLPLLIGCAVRGDVGAGTMLAVLLFLLLTSGLFGALGLLCSYQARKTSVATATALMVTLLLCVGTAVADALVQSFTRQYGGVSAILWINPFYALGALTYLIDPFQFPTLQASDQAGSVVAVYVALALGATVFCLSSMIVRYRQAVRER